MKPKLTSLIFAVFALGCGGSSTPANTASPSNPAHPPEEETACLEGQDCDDAPLEAKLKAQTKLRHVLTKQCSVLTEVRLGARGPIVSSQRAQMLGATLQLQVARPFVRRM